MPGSGSSGGHGMERMHLAKLEPWTYLAPLTALGLLFAAGCADGRTDGDRDVDALEGSGSMGLEENGDGAEDGADDGPMKLDVPAGSTGDGAGDGDDPPVGCSKVDLLFVIDSSGSMIQEQASLIDAFPGFVEGMQAALSNVDSLHVGVTVAGRYLYNDESCQELGALVTQTGGQDASGAVCGPYASGAAFMDETEPNLEGAFGCAAQVGTQGSSFEEQVAAALAATDPEINGDGGCNEGFLRDDALLVVVLISDEEDETECFPLIDCLGGTEGEPEDWFETLAVRKGDERNVVVLSIIGGEDAETCEAEPAPRIETFTELFTHGSTGNICDGSYAEYFADAIGVVDAGCEGFVPPG